MMMGYLLLWIWVDYILLYLINTFIVIKCKFFSYQILNHCLGSMAIARVQVCGTQAARVLQDLAAERCSMPYRAPELFNVESYSMVDERTDIWVSITIFLCFF